jgi:hypothetical protein
MQPGLPGADPASTDNPAMSTTGGPSLGTAATDPNARADATRRELAAAAQQLGALLDDSWRRYLSLPNGVFSGNGVPSVESLEQSLRRFDVVTRDSRYNLLLERQEFQHVHRLLKTYTDQVRLLSRSAGTGAGTGAPSAMRSQGAARTPR